jgi:peptidoglycan/xylan/chitin deacetylase (PgdA/CDA1 family)
MSPFRWRHDDAIHLPHPEKIGHRIMTSRKTETAHMATSIILLYHRMGLPRPSSLVWGQYVAPALFRAQLGCLAAQGRQGISLERAITGPPQGRNSFALTFDDAYLSVYEHAYPLLIERGLTATLYVVVDSAGKINLWDCQRGDCTERIMTLAQIREMADRGFEIGSHTLSHPHLTKLDDDRLRRELADSKHRLEDLLGREVSSLSYPYGDHDRRVIEATREAGYRNAVSTLLGTVAAAKSCYEIPRINVRWNAVGPLLKRKIKRAVMKSTAAPCHP